jgi:hypothetical protein
VTPANGPHVHHGTGLAGVDVGVVAQIIGRAGSADFEAWWACLEGSGFCASTVHLVGQGGPAGVGEVMGRCKNRRSAVCPSCSAIYAGDTWQLVHAGIAGGHHGLPATVAAHPWSSPP